MKVEYILMSMLSILSVSITGLFIMLDHITEGRFSLWI